MKGRMFHAAMVFMLIPALLVQGCANLDDDAFAHAVKSGNSRSAVSAIQPGQARLHIYETNGRWYYPIHYTICRGDAESTFALARSGSPTILDGRSLAYNAARVKRTALARKLASAGYGDNSDVADALAANRRDEQQGRENAALASMAVLGLFALMASGGSSSATSWEQEQQERDFQAQAHELQQRSIRDSASY